MTALLDTVREALRIGRDALVDPGSDPIAALIALAAVVLALLVAILVFYLILLTFESKGRPRAEQVAAPKRSRSGPRRVVALVVTVVAIGAAAYGWHYSASDDMCARCHFNAAAIESRNEGVHGEVTCRECHIGPGVDAAILQRLRGVENVVTQLVGDPSKAVRADVPNGACLRCHESILDGVTVARSVSMRHSDVLELGQACIDCHNTEGHGKQITRPQYPSMSQCIVCHDDERASAECSLCHGDDVGVAVRRLARPYAQTFTERQDCRGCHPMESVQRVSRTRTAALRAVRGGIPRATGAASDSDVHGVPQRR